MLKKLSLAALVAMGSMSVASATPLTDAIKGVNLNGYLRLRVYNDDPKSGSAANRYRTTAAFKFTMPVSEEMKFVTVYSYDWSIYSGARTSGKNYPIDEAFFLQYHKNNLTALVGKIPVPTPVTGTGVGEANAAGAIVMYKINDNITVVAAGLDALVQTKPIAVGGNNTYAAAALYNQDNLSAQAWYFKVDNIINSDIVLRADYKMDNIGLHADFATADLDNPTSKTQTYFNVSASYKQDTLSGKLGYAQTGKDGGTVVLDGDSPLAAVLPTEQKTGIANTADTTAIYAKIANSLDAKTNVFAAVSLIDDSSAANKDYNEYMVGVKYKYTKKMKISAYYSILDGSNGAKNNDNNEARVEFKYSF